MHLATQQCVDDARRTSAGRSRSPRAIRRSGVSATMRANATAGLDLFEVGGQHSSNTAAA